MLSVRDIVTAARDASPLFDSAKHPDPVVVRFLSAYATTLASKLMRRDPMGTATEVVVAMPLADFAAGIPVPEYIKIHGVVAVTTDATPRHLAINLIAPADRGKVPGATAWVQGQRVYLSGDAGQWRSVGQIAVSLTPSIPATTTLDSTLPLPSSAAPALIAACTAFLAVRSGDADPRYATMAADAERAFLDEVGFRRAGEPFRIQEVWP